MSAISAIVEQGAAANDDYLNASLAAMDAYGPDGMEQWRDVRAALGAQRMVVARDAGVCVWHDRATGQTIVADAWLDNRAELLTLLGIELAQGEQISNSQLLLRAYQRWGRDCLRTVLGDYAFVIWDARTETLFCARDHIGIRPLYYALTAERWVVASAIPGLLAVPGVSDALDEAYIAAYLLDSQFMHAEATFHSAIRKVPPGHTLTVRQDTVRCERWWFPEQAPNVRLGSDAAYVEALLELYQRAVCDCVRTDLPVGAHCSGGLDSSSVMALAGRALSREGRALTAAFAWLPPQNDTSTLEHTLIEEVCRQEGLELRCQQVTAEDIAALLAVDLTRYPVTSTLLSEAVVQRDAADQGVRVMLSGWGGDEGVSFSGRGYWSGLLAQGNWLQLLRESAGRGSNRWAFIARQAVLPLLPFAPALMQRFRPGSPRRTRRAFINPAFARSTKPLTMPDRHSIGVRDTQIALLQTSHLSERIDSWTAHGASYNLQYRFPLLDRRLLEFALGLPPNQYVRGPWKRWLMRTMCSRILPDTIAWNQDKSDTVRVASIRQVMRAGVALAGARLASHATPVSRSIYVDLPELIATVTAPDYVATGARGFRGERHAMQLLDF